MMRYKINDVHIHLGRSNSINVIATPEKILDMIDKHKISNIALMSLNEDIDRNNRKIAELAKKHKSIHGLYWIQHHKIKNDIRILSQGLKDGVYEGVKFHGAFEHLPVSSAIYHPIMELLSDKNALILVHCGRYKDGSRSSVTSFEHAMELALNYPKLKVIMAHMGGNDTAIVKKAVSYVKDIKNIYFDTAGISAPIRVEYAVEHLGVDRILFGSDSMWCSFRANYYNVYDAMISDSDKEKIFSDNFEIVLLQGKF